MLLFLGGGGGGVEDKRIVTEMRVSIIEGISFSEISLYMQGFHCGLNVKYSCMG